MSPKISVQTEPMREPRSSVVSLDDRSLSISQLVRIHDESIARQIKERIARKFDEMAEAHHEASDQELDRGNRSDARYYNGLAEAREDDAARIRSIPDAELVGEEK